MTAVATLTASLEDYLEAIFHIIAEKQAVRPKDIARRLKVSNASVTGALRSLAQKKLINYAPYDVITLTPNGKAAAKDVIRRHEVLRDFFVNVLAVDESDADKAACQMEHCIPKGILERFIQFAEFVEVCPRGGSKWIAGFAHYCDRDRAQDNCERCISLALEEVRRKRKKGSREKMTSSKLKDLRPGQKGKVVKIKSRGSTNKRIVEMGVTPGAVVEVERVAPLGDPIDIKVKGYHLSLRKEEADRIEVEVL
ncbi:MAG: DtxR family transcriptional regulator [Deltaproteobacteria bacterium]|nr:DtxR family transcriptional regulator [Deltaproteobacteria bacterium]MBW1929708.1 DtxR family transcriptional regulator [Deltaproteobacteria bacterium]MBW2023998.1 DtxR family transcriptional regulator [Deltaproteobacteria bacterium]MBW2125016.1 DtxR family transcriptional regulator [Deltaproteobacteria bacterium]RLB21425.1 MAG: DtxR family transcriptional regulator [Deltaproteobacteria bacterium]